MITRRCQLSAGESHGKERMKIKRAIRSKSVVRHGKRRRLTTNSSEPPGLRDKIKLPVGRPLQLEESRGLIT